jgi:Tol biopolymer transport system component
VAWHDAARQRRAGGSTANSYSASPSVSADGRYVVFASQASNLVPGDDNPDTSFGQDIFVRDLRSGVTRMVNVDARGAPAADYAWRASISGNGRYVAFVSTAPLDATDTDAGADVFVRDLSADTTRLVSEGDVGDSTLSPFPSISATGQHIAFNGQLHAGEGHFLGTPSVFLRRMPCSPTRLIVGGPDKERWIPGYAETLNPSLSWTGRYIAFTAATVSIPDPAVGTDVFLYDDLDRTIRPVSGATSTP